MKNASGLYDALSRFIGQCAWADQRHAYVLVWMVVGVIQSGECESDAVAGARSDFCPLCPEYPYMRPGSSVDDYDCPLGIEHLILLRTIY